MSSKIKSLIWRLRYLRLNDEDRIEAANELQKMMSLIDEVDALKHDIARHMDIANSAEPLVRINMACPHCGKFAEFKLEAGQ